MSEERKTFSKVSAVVVRGDGTTLTGEVPLYAGMQAPDVVRVEGQIYTWHKRERGDNGRERHIYAKAIEGHFEQKEQPRPIAWDVADDDGSGH